MHSFLKGLLTGIIVLVGVGAILLPIVLTVNYSSWWLLLYVIEFPIMTGFICMGIEM